MLVCAGIDRGIVVVTVAVLLAPAVPVHVDVSALRLVHAVVVLAVGLSVAVVVEAVVAYRLLLPRSFTGLGFANRELLRTGGGEALQRLVSHQAHQDEAFPTAQEDVFHGLVGIWAGLVGLLAADPLTLGVEDVAVDEAAEAVHAFGPASAAVLVDLPIAVVVHAVVAGLGHAGVDVVVVVVAVSVLHAPAVAVVVCAAALAEQVGPAVHVDVVDISVAVVVHAVFTVGLGGHALVAAAQALVDGEPVVQDVPALLPLALADLRGDLVLDVLLAVPVLPGVVAGPPLAPLVAGPCVHVGQVVLLVGVGVLAADGHVVVVRDGGLHAAGGIPVLGDPPHLLQGLDGEAGAGALLAAVLVQLTVAVVVDLVVAVLVGAGVDRLVGVVAVGVVGHVAFGLRARDQALIGIAVAVAVRVQEPLLGGKALVHVPVAVVVDPVTDLGLGPVDVGIGVVAVVAILHVSLGCLARQQGHLGIAVAVVVRVRVPGDLAQRALLVHVSVAVVVESVAGFFRARMDGDVRVVAVALADRVLVAVFIGLVRGQGAIAVVVHAVAQLGRARVGVVVAVVAVPLAQPVAVAVHVFLGYRDVVVAVVVDPVAQLLGAGVGGGIRVVAVAIADHHAIGVVIDLLRSQRAVAVVVDPVAQLGSPKVGGPVCVVAVAFTLGHPVAVVVDLVVG